MGFTVSNVSSRYLQTTGLKLEKAMNSDPSQTAQSRPVESEKAAKKITKNRYQASTSRTELLGLQQSISKTQITTNSINRIQSRLESLGSDPEPENRKKAAKDISQIVSEDKAFSQNYPNRSSSASLRAVTIEEPPRPGRYTVSILSSAEQSGPEAIRYRITVQQAGSDVVKTIETAVSPASGLIEGISLHFDQPPPANAELLIASSANHQFPLPPVQLQMEKLANASNAEAKLILQDLNVLFSELNSGINKHMQELQNRFQGMMHAQENLASMEGGDLSSVQKAVQSVTESRMAMVRDSTSAMKLFSGISSEQAENLLKD